MIKKPHKHVTKNDLQLLSQCRYLVVVENKLQQTIIMPIDIDEFQVNLTHELGRGAFGTVYLCHDKNMVKFAAKKLTG